jgi:hypothetical protein
MGQGKVCPPGFIKIISKEFINKEKNSHGR